MHFFHGSQRNKKMSAINIWLILFIVWGLPLTYYRSKFRKIVYQTNDWTINIKPLFMKEIQALFGNMYPKNQNYIRTRNFYRVYLSVYVLLFTVYSVTGKTTSNKNNMEIKVGDTIPAIVLKDQNGEMFDLTVKTAGKSVVLFFYPKDDSPGCTAQACSFRDQFEDFKDANAVVIGISGQSVESHKKFAEKHRLTYTLLSDEGNKIRKQFGVPTNFFGMIPGRVTYVIDKTGKVVYIFNSQTQVNQHIEKTLSMLKTLN
jgi:thioredoxin-dependent peroxiredoxin